MTQRTIAIAAALLASSSQLVFAQAPREPAKPTSPASGPGSEADKRFRRGVELYGEGDFNAALIEFRRAYELDPRFQALYNIGETYFQLQDYANALETLEQYLKDGGAKVSAERRDEVQKEIEKLRVRVATIEVTTREPGIEIAVDDIAKGRSPLTMLVSAGRRRIAANQPGRPPSVQIVDIAGGDTRKLTFDIGGEEPVPYGKQRSAPPAPWIVTGVLAAGAIVTGSLALSSSSSLKEKLDARPGDRDAIASAKSKTFALALTTDILAGSALVMTGVSIFFTVSALSSKKPEPRDTAGLRWIGSERSPSSTLVLTAGPRSLSFSGSF